MNHQSSGHSDFGHPYLSSPSFLPSRHQGKPLFKNPQSSSDMRRNDKYLIFSLAIIGVAGVYLAIINSCDRPALLPGEDTARTSRFQWPHPSLAVAELPGYTGWARPATTAASRFRITHRDPKAATHQNWTVTVSCESCSRKNDDDTPWFYVRAYGPAILTGVVERPDLLQSDYVVTFYPVVDGQYTVEVVMTYSHPVRPESFPLSTQQLPPPAFEGYMLPQFPLILQVQATTTTSKVLKEIDMPYCLVDHLSILKGSVASNSLWSRANWRVTSTNLQPGTKRTTTDMKSNVSILGYQLGLNSLGFSAAYEYTNCRLIQYLNPAMIVHDFPTVCRTPWNSRRPLNVMLIGDSVMRIQKEWMEKQISTVDNILVTFTELFGGILKCSRLSGPNITASIHPGIAKTNDESTARRVVIFNSGLHDIHRLCGHEWIDDRRTYLTDTELLLPCTTVYRQAIRELTSSVLRIPADAYIFQTTTAAWPKYGNYGVTWEACCPQELPLDFVFVEKFNDIAVDEIQAVSSQTMQKVHIVDAYWITLARPDNREVRKKNDLGKKMSHPGLEVVSHMVRVVWQVAIQLLCL